MRRITLLLPVALVVALMLAVAGPASATIHPIVESLECAQTQTADVANPPGQTPGATPGNGQNALRAETLTSGGEAFSSNPDVEFFGYEPGGAEHKLDGQCGQVGQ
jgi:hypothetical protein